MVDLYFEVVGGLNNRGKIRVLESYIKKREGGDTFFQNEDKGKSLFKSTGNQENLVMKDKNVEWAKDMLAPLLAREKEMEANKGLDSSRTTDEWLQIFDILSADNCYAESIYDPGRFRDYVQRC